MNKHDWLSNKNFSGDLWRCTRCGLSSIVDPDTNPNFPSCDEWIARDIHEEMSYPDIHMMSEPVFFGKMPVRTELTVLPADDPKITSLGWTVKEYNGGEVTRVGNKDILINENDLKVGDEIEVPGLFGSLKMTVEQNSSGGLRAICGHTVANLEFNKDDRHCWVSSSMMNLRGIKKLTVG